MLLVEFILFSVYLFCLASAFFPKQEPDKTAEQEFGDAVTKYLLHIEKNVNDKTE